MSRTVSRHRYSIGDLVSAAYRQAGFVTRNQRVASLVAAQLLESWLGKSDRPDMIRKMRTVSP